MDFCQIRTRTVPKEKDVIEIYPEFKICKSKDLMIRGKAFYAIWDDARGLWTTDSYDVQRLIDKDIEAKIDETRKIFPEATLRPRTMMDYSTNSWKTFQSYVNNLSDNSHQLDSKLTFANTPVVKTDYVSKSLPYPLESGNCEGYDEIISTLYDPDERAKIEWAIGAIVSGESTTIQKFLVFYGDAGAGKSTILNIIQKLFEGYYVSFDAKSLASNNNQFATEAFRDNPLVAIQHDGDLSRIEDNTKLNSIVSHEMMTMNEKYKSSYTARANCFLFMATNRPVKITDAKSGIIRRLIDVRPSGRKLPFNRYQNLMSKVNFELGAIAYHCLQVYKKMGKDYYNAYRPMDMMYKTDFFFNFVEDKYDIFDQQDSTTLKLAYAMYKEYCEDSGTEAKLPMYKFREELKNYFEHYSDVERIDGKQIRKYYSGFIRKKFRPEEKTKDEAPKEEESWLKLDCTKSLLDDIYANYPAQYATDDGTPIIAWDKVTTTLADICTDKLHYVMLPENHIVIDFDLKDEHGEKSVERNLEAASKWPKTYAEFSKGGAGIHLHYIYDGGDPKQLPRLYAPDIEVKVFTGKSSCRRKLTKCNDIPIATISSGLPLKEEKTSVINEKAVKSEKGLRRLINRHLRKEIMGSTASSIGLINDILDKAYDSGMSYDISDMKPTILAFAAGSTHQSDRCTKIAMKMKYKSEAVSESDEYSEDAIVFFDIEVFPNLLLVNWKYAGPQCKCVRMINPSQQDISELLKKKLVGFNCRRYDNHILYARYLGKSIEEIYEISQAIISGDKAAMFGQAYNISYTDVYDFSSKKQSLKKFEIDLGIHHQELGLPWNQPVPEDKWKLVAEYCDNDVLATEAVFNARQADFVAREILADLAGGTVNDTTNQLTTQLIFGTVKNPQSSFVYRDLAEPVHLPDDSPQKEFLKANFPEMMAEPFGEAQSDLPYFPGYSFKRGSGDLGRHLAVDLAGYTIDDIKIDISQKPVSSYGGFDSGEGGFVWSKPGMYGRVITFDVASMHPHSITSEYLFGQYTVVFNDLLNTRIAIKHKDFEKAGKMFGGKLAKYLTDPAKAKQLSQALKIAINSVYGLTAAHFDNAFHDPRNIDNIVAKRGALFMIDLLNYVHEKGGEVIHIKTDSIKVLDPSPELQKDIISFGKRYGYDFEIEHIFEKICLVNNAVYIAKLAEDDPDDPGKWTATGKQFAEPYVFKTLFSKEPIVFDDYCQTKSVKSAMYLDFDEDLGEDEHNRIFVGKCGQFCPVLPGTGGARLVREQDGKFNSVTGAKDYRWREAEFLRELKKEDTVDEFYYRKLVDDAVDDLSKFGDIEWFLDESVGSPRDE